MSLKHYLIYEAAGMKFATDIAEVESVHSTVKREQEGNIEDMKIALRLYNKLVPIISLREVYNSKAEHLIPEQTLIFFKSQALSAKIVGVQVDKILDIAQAQFVPFPKIKERGYVEVEIDLKSEKIEVFAAADFAESVHCQPDSIPNIN